MYVHISHFFVFRDIFVVGTGLMVIRFGPHYLVIVYLRTNGLNSHRKVNSHGYDSRPIHMSETNL